MNRKPLILTLIVVLMGLSLAAFLWLPGWAAVTAAEPSPRTGHTLTPLGDYVYLFGGWVETTALAAAANAPRAPLGIPANDLSRFDGDEKQWRLLQCENPPAARFLHSAAVSGGWLWVFFGVDASYNLLDDIWSYNPGTNTWTQQPSTGDVPLPRAMAAAASLDGYR
jgi:N-acetylneuraminic acid mutarotase